MATTVYGREGDDVIITRIDFGQGDEYMVEVRKGMGYFCIYNTFDYDKALKVAKAKKAELKD